MATEPFAPWQGGVIVVGCRHNTAEFIDALLHAGRSVAGIVTLGREPADKAQVPTWVDLKARFGGRIPVHVARSYALKSDEDKAMLSACRAEVGFCIGWQRLLPDWFLESVRHGVFGMHASQFPLPRGIGRSPINWGVIHGADRLQAHVFRYDTSPDSGPLLATVPIHVLPHDDIHSLQQKCRVVFNRVAERHWDALVAGTAQLYPPLAGGEELIYPKRTEDDGGIDWTWTVRAVADWVRAQTRPYPGAYCLYRGSRHKVWRAHDFGLAEDRPSPPGTVVERFDDGSLVVRAGDGLIHLVDHDLPNGIQLGELLA